MLFATGGLSDSESRKKIEELQREKEKMEETIRDLKESWMGTEEVVALQQKFEGVECALRRT